MRHALNLATDDEEFLDFLAATVHPMVRTDAAEVSALLDIYNRNLVRDNWEIVEVSQISGYPVFAGRRKLAIPALSHQITAAATAGDLQYISSQITRMQSAVDSDPELAIGTAKEIVETVCSTILDTKEILVERDWDLPRLVKETAKVLNISPDSVPDSRPGSNSIRKVLGSLGGVVAGIAELRNSYGTGHGRTRRSRGLGPRHARLAVGAASTLAVFFFETYNYVAEKEESADA